MVGKLARYMRILGYDTVYSRDIDDSHLIDIALLEERVILTRDTALINKTLVKKYLLIDSDNPADQLYQVIKHFDLHPGRSQFLSLCLECNCALVPIDKLEVKSQIWPYVYDNHDSFKICRSCKRIFWQGDHVRAMQDRLASWNIVLRD